MNKKTNNNFGYTLGLWLGMIVVIGVIILITLGILLGIKYLVGLL